MGVASVTNTFVTSTVANPTQVNTNFTDLVTFLNAQTIHKDGAVAMTGNLAMGNNKVTGLAAPTAASDAARKQDTDNGVIDIVTFAREGTLTVAAGKGRYYLPYAITLLGIRSAVNTAPTGAAVLVDVNKNGTTVFTTQGNRPSIAISGFVSSEVTNMDVTAVAAGDYLSVDIDQIGSTLAGADLTVMIRYQRA